MTFSCKKYLPSSKTKRVLLTILLIGIIAPFSIFVCLYRYAMSTGLPGRRGGPQDAFRHTYSSALTARYISPVAVEIFTWASERSPENKFDKMDIHNNKIGITIGMSTGDLSDLVRRKISEGQINATADNVVTWLPKEDWDNGL